MIQNSPCNVFTRFYVYTVFFVATLFLHERLFVKLTKCSLRFLYVPVCTTHPKLLHFCHLQSAMSLLEFYLCLSRVTLDFAPLFA